MISALRWSVFKILICMLLLLLPMSSAFAAGLSCNTPRTTSTEVAGCVSNPAGYAYRNNPNGIRDVVYWTVTDIPTTIQNPAPHSNMNGIGSLITPSVAGQTCNPRCTVTVENMILKTPSVSGSGCDAIYEIVGCSVPDSVAQACITTTTTAVNGTATRNDCVKLSGGGRWVVNGTTPYPGPNGYSYDEADNGTAFKKTVTVTQFYNYCGNFSSYEAANAWALSIFDRDYAPQGWDGIEFVGWSQACHDGVSQPLWVGVYEKTPMTYTCY